MRLLVVFTILYILISALSFTSTVQAKPSQADSAYDLINAVNALRASYGLPAYSINSILMSTAQAQAEFMAATGTVTHYGPGGIGVTDRLLAAGYPLAGDLSLGGFRSENITGGSESMTAQTAVNQWTGDAPHLNTMISPDLTEIGAGVAVANGRVYYVIDCARPATGAASTVPSGEAVIPVVVISTPNENGEVLHEVQAGQTLWQIAIEYGVKIDEIKSLNNLTDNTIYPGETLLIKVEAIGATATLMASPTVAPTISPTAPATLTAVLRESTSTLESSPSHDTPDNTAIMSLVIGLVALALLAGGFVAWRGESKNELG